jgi:hypothetical protein
MEHYLLAWYGMADLRTALELEDTGEPVLSVLLLNIFPAH